jgi:predicted negative regulator of RcsB-dependent stress response
MRKRRSLKSTCGGRHRVGLVATTLIVLVVLLASGGIGWALWERAAQRTEHARRAAETEKTVIGSLARAEEAAKRAEGLPRTTSIEMKAVVVAWGEAAAALAEGEAALQTGEADDALHRRVSEIHERVAARRARAEQVAHLFRDLDDARMARATWVDPDFDFAGPAVKYRKAFAAYG